MGRGAYDRSNVWPKGYTTDAKLNDMLRLQRLTDFYDNLKGKSPHEQAEAWRSKAGTTRISLEDWPALVEDIAETDKRQCAAESAFAKATCIVSRMKSTSFGYSQLASLSDCLRAEASNGSLSVERQTDLTKNLTLLIQSVWHKREAGITSAEDCGGAPGEGSRGDQEIDDALTALVSRPAPAQLRPILYKP